MRARELVLLPRLLGASLLVGLLSCGGGGAREQLRRVDAPPEAQGPPLATLVVVGDTIAHGMDPEQDPLEGVAPLLEGADVFVLNHEGVLATRPLPGACGARPNQTLLDADPRSADAYARASSVVATLANNHVLDCSGDGLLLTREALRDRSFATVGAGADLGEACAPLRLLAGDVDVAFLAYLAMPTQDLDAGPLTPGAARWQTCGGAATVAALKVEGAFVVVALHLHLAPSWASETAPQHRALVEEVLEAGADLVVAHGPHVPQGVLVRDGRVALLSLGNFLFAHDRRLPFEARDVLVARLAVHAGQVLLSLAAARLDEQGRPHLASVTDTDRILENLARQSSEEGTTLVRHADRAYLLLDR